MFGRVSSQNNYGKRCRETRRDLSCCADGLLPRRICRFAVARWRGFSRPRRPVVEPRGRLFASSRGGFPPGDKCSRSLLGPCFRRRLRRLPLAGPVGARLRWGKTGLSVRPFGCSRGDAAAVHGGRCAVPHLPGRSGGSRSAARPSALASTARAVPCRPSCNPS